MTNKLVSKTFTIARGTSAQTVTVACTTTNASGYINGTSTASATVSVPALASYTVSYNANGGSGAPSSQTKWYGTSLTLSSTKPTRTGYTFKGWATSSTGSVAYAAGASYASNAAVTLYAVWQINTWTVSYNANGGSGAPSAQTKTYGTTLTLSSTKPTRTGYTFQGWATSSTGSVAYAAGGSYTANAAATLYAVWKINTWTVSYNANGGSGAPGSQTKTYGQALTLSSTKPTRTGYTFQGWATSSTGSVAYAAGGSYTGNAALALYAIWKINTWTVSYNANGGSGEPSSQTKTYNQTLTLSSTKPTRTGYTFQGWGTSASDTTVDYAAGASYTSNAAATLYAIWKINTWAVSYDANGGTGAPSAQTKTYNVTLTLSTTQPARTGYTFQGWATSSTATTAAYEPGDSYTSNAALALYAVWKINTWTVSYNANGGSGAPGPQTKTYGQALALSSTVPTKDGYDFLGWATSSTATTAEYTAGGSYTSDSGATFYAVWKLKTYTVSYDANGGAGAPEAQTKTHGQALALSSTVPAKDGYIFLGWAASPEAATADYAPGDSYADNEAVTLYAVWMLFTYTVSYDANGGTGAPGDQEKIPNVAMTVSDTIPARDGYVFTGWAESAEASEAAYAPKAPYEKEEDATLYAVWAEHRRIYIRVPDGSALGAVYVRA